MVPKAKSEMTFVEEMWLRFMFPLAKWTKAGIRPSTLGQAVGGPNLVLNRQPHEEFGLGASPSLPNCLLHRGEGGSQKLRFVSGRRQVVATNCMLPSNIVLHKLIQMKILD